MDSVGTPLTKHSAEEELMAFIQPVSRARTVPDPEDILGQFFFAFGQGAGHMRVQRSAIAALRNRYRPAIHSACEQWDSAAPHVLSLVAQVGRLASAIATQAGRAAINETDFLKARRVVESNAHRQAESSGQLIAGPFCPPVMGEREEDAPSLPLNAPELHLTREPVPTEEAHEATSH
jgi:hypothetical protein